MHPANVEVVTYISASTTLLSGFFSILAFYLFLIYRLRNKRYSYLCFASVAYFFSVMSKEEGVAGAVWKVIAVHERNAENLIPKLFEPPFLFERYYQHG